MVHGFYAAMGGFAFQSPAPDGSENEVPVARMALNLEAIGRLIDDIHQPAIFEVEEYLGTAGESEFRATRAIPPVVAPVPERG
ncbi:uncharacterized protein A1O5_08597 [Cladophialophora psammophila CBS 110553]|uniref:Uncharacterized protein n=1 Tax=Cladophialophora psammophila CBS 110553 TaxID=1182543 RepID=W9WJ98_9EURO|nr:uncharacterized protein A1O5_08597 [Cladophialophora psammophila CBS 110553]EXJ67983.1 hypothetical protein A1O5_08597 [Cladophialophora psammophila CBS 110553]